MTGESKPDRQPDWDVAESFRRARTAVDAVRRDLEELRVRAHGLVKAKAAEAKRAGRVRPAK